MNIESTIPSLSSIILKWLFLKSQRKNSEKSQQGTKGSASLNTSNTSLYHYDVSHSMGTVLIKRFWNFWFLKVKVKINWEYLLIALIHRSKQYLFLFGKSIHTYNHSACHSKACWNHHWSQCKVQLLDNYLVLQSPSFHTSPMTEEVLWRFCYMEIKLGREGGDSIKAQTHKLFLLSV